MYYRITKNHQERRVNMNDNNTEAESISFLEIRKEYEKLIEESYQKGFREGSKHIHDEWENWNKQRDKAIADYEQGEADYMIIDPPPNFSKKIGILKGKKVIRFHE